MADIDTDGVLGCWREYMMREGGRIPGKREFLENMELKMLDGDYLNDMSDLLRPGVEFDARAAYERVKAMILDKL